MQDIIFIIIIGNISTSKNRIKDEDYSIQKDTRYQ